ncbi:hypothetical protein [Shewanella marina]|uniref:hypothetical protein n=1 Tax=Shewanella marina TaxID=487319 RepID=UPI000471AE35|nr:hypothetical protein [Shewanella marina]
MFNRLMFWRKSSSLPQIGLFLGLDKAWVYVPQTANTPIRTEELDYQSNGWDSLFAQIADDFGHCELSIVLSPKLYQLLIADKPAVEGDELASALLWSIKDMVSIPVHNIHLDYFESPITNSSKLQVVVADKAMLSKLCASAQDYKLTIANIGVEELTLSNLFVSDKHAHMIVCLVPGQDLLLAVVREGALYMQRHVRGFGELYKMNAEQLSYGIADNLTLEMQRSMDYFESLLHQSPVASIELLMDGEVNALAQLLTPNFNQPVNVIEKMSVETTLAMLAYSECTRAANVSEASDE